MNITSLSRAFAPLALIIITLSAVNYCSPASSANRQDRITDNRAAKIHKYIDKAFTKVDEASRPAERDMLVARLHVCTLINRLMMQNAVKPGRKRALYEVRHAIFAKLTAAMSENYSNQRNEHFAAQARAFIKTNLLGSDSAELQIIFNSCIDIEAGKITHALSNMRQQKTLTASGEPAPK